MSANCSPKPANNSVWTSRTQRSSSRASEPSISSALCSPSIANIGTWVEVSEVRLNHPNVTYPEPELHLTPYTLPHTPVKQAICFTNTDFVLASDYKDCVFDMELAFIAALGFNRLHSLKYVSDNLSLHTYHELTHGVE